MKETSTTTAVQHYRFQIGKFACIAASDGEAAYPPQNFFANAPKEAVEESLHQRGLPTDHIITPYTCLYVDTGEHRVLVDVGAGHLFPTTGMLLPNLKAARIEPASIDTIIITHAHPDHIGGNVDEHGAPLYPNARYFIWKEEWDFWGSAVPAQWQKFVPFVRANLDPVKDKLVYLEQETEIVPGIHVIAAPGHTPGHFALSIISGGNQLIHVSDTVLYPLHLEHPDWVPVYDILPEKAEASKHRIFDRAAENALVFAHHFPPFPNLGHVIKQGKGWQWKPIDANQ